MAATDRPSRITFLVWRDTTHPDGGGSEVYVEHMARWLARRGHQVTIQCAAHGNAPADDVRDGVRFRRRGGRLSVYPRALAYLASPEGRRSDVVVDVHNGIPFASTLIRRRGVRVLVHHVHREQWQIIYPGRRGRIGWWLESWLAPRLYRGAPYVTVSESSRADLVGLGIAADRIALVRNGIDVPHPSRRQPRSVTPRLVVLGRLVPHKQVEHALDTVAALAPELPELSLDVIGEGWWHAELTEYAARLGVAGRVRFHGFVPDAERDALLDAAWLMLIPSVKEGWGIAVMEAAAHAVPAIGYASAGGITESIVADETGLLVISPAELTARTRDLLADTEARLSMGKKARERADGFGWAASAARFEELILRQD